MNTSDCKILFTDLDGTLLDDRKQISSENQKAIFHALDCGHRIVITSGRPLASAKALSEKLGLDTPGCFVIAYNGACIYDFASRKEIYSQRLPLSQVRPVFDAAYSYGLHVQTYSDTEVLAERQTSCLEEYYRNTQVPCRVVSDVIKALTTPPYKILFMHENDPLLLEQFRQDMLRRYPNQFDIFFSQRLYLELVSPGVSKGSAIVSLCSLLGIPIENSIAAGDAENDISMFQAAGTAAVMANASKEIKHYGTYITSADNNHSGVAEIIRHFLLSTNA